MGLPVLHRMGLGLFHTEWALASSAQSEPGPVPSKVGRFYTEWACSTRVGLDLLHRVGLVLGYTQSGIVPVAH